MPSSLARLARSNPVELDDDLGRQPAAQAVLSEILATKRAVPGRTRRAWSARAVTIAFASLLVGAGAAVAATDPFGLWRSSSPGTARYSVDPARHVATSTPSLIRCAAAGSAGSRCGAQVSGQAYELIDRIQAPTALTRGAMTAALLQRVRGGQISTATQTGFRADLAAVSDAFFARLNEAMRFGTVGGGGTSVPPRGVPLWLVCEPAAATIACRDLNGDERAAVGSGVYMALPARDWVAASDSGPFGNDSTGATTQLMTAIFGGQLTPPEARLLRDLASTAGVHASSSSSPTQVHGASGG